MPIAFPPAQGGSSISDTLRVVLSGVTAAEVILAGQAIALVDDGGSPVFRLCGDTPATYGDSWIGFAYQDMNIGDNFSIITGRGSRVTPVVEGAVALVPETGVWLSATPGEVAQSPRSGPGIVSLRVGTAHTDAEMFVAADSKVAIP